MAGAKDTVKKVEKKTAREKKAAAGKEAVAKEKPVKDRAKPFNQILTVIIVVVVCAVAAAVFFNPQEPTGQVTVPSAGSGAGAGSSAGGITTFTAVEGEIELADGKPVVRLFSTTKCPFCRWIKGAFDETMREYLAEGKIVARHWVLDAGDNTLTEGQEGGIPHSEYAVFLEGNPERQVPFFVFGKRYYRIGNGHMKYPDDLENPNSPESLQHLEQEKAEFRAVIEALLQELEEWASGFESLPEALEE